MAENKSSTFTRFTSVIYCCTYYRLQMCLFSMRLCGIKCVVIVNLLQRYLPMKKTPISKVTSSLLSFVLHSCCSLLKHV